MSKTELAILLCAAALMTSLLLIGQSGVAGRVLTFDGGPSGGVYNVFAEGLAELLAGSKQDASVQVAPSAGSVSNLLRLDEKTIDMAIVGAADIAEGREGNLDDSPAELKNVVAVTRLYAEYAQLAVLADSPIQTLEDLAGTRVAVGSRGSGTLSSARRFFKAIGLWDKIKPEYAGFDLASKDLTGGRVEAIWQMSGYPSASLSNIAEKMPIRLIDLGQAAGRSSLFSDHPIYEPGVIPAGTYQGVFRKVTTFTDQAIWVASPSVDDGFIYEALSRLYAPEGLAFMRQVHPAARQLDPSKGMQSVTIDFHPGAKRFWDEFASKRPAQKIAP